MDKKLASFLLHLKKIGAVQIAPLGEGFQFKHHEKEPDAPLAPIKFHLCTPDLRPEGKLSPADVAVLARFMVNEVFRRKIRFRGIAGLPNVGYPIAKAMAEYAYALGVHDVEILRLEKIVEGGKRFIGPIKNTGSLLPRDTVLVADDLVFAATTKEEGIEQVRVQFHAPYCIVFFDYDVGAREVLKKLNAELLCVATIAQALDIFRDNGEMTAEEDERCRAFLSFERNRRLQTAA